MEDPDIAHKLPSWAKYLIVILIIALAGAILWIKQTSDLRNTITPQTYSFTEVDGLVTAKGSWVSADTDLANPLQTLEIQCWESFKHCFVNYSEVSQFESIFDFALLTAYSEIHEISRWTPDLIETIPSESGFGCVEYQIRLDRRSKTVTSTRRTISTAGICEGMQDKPIILNLGDGLDRVNQSKHFDKQK